MNGKYLGSVNSKPGRKSRRDLSCTCPSTNCFEDNPNIENVQNLLPNDDLINQMSALMDNLLDLIYFKDRESLKDNYF
jgi:hypothetical protein